MFNRNYDELSKRIEELGCRLEKHISAEKDILYEREFKCKRKIIYSKIYYSGWML